MHAGGFLTLRDKALVLTALHKLFRTPGNILAPSNIEAQAPADYLHVQPYYVWANDSQKRAPKANCQHKLCVVFCTTMFSVMT
jgi:hypothetical protein